MPMVKVSNGGTFPDGYTIVDVPHSGNTGASGNVYNCQVGDYVIGNVYVGSSQTINDLTIQNATILQYKYATGNAGRIIGIIAITTSTTFKIVGAGYTIVGVLLRKS